MSFDLMAWQAPWQSMFINNNIFTISKLTQKPYFSFLNNLEKTTILCTVSPLQVHNHRPKKKSTAQWATLLSFSAKPLFKQHFFHKSQGTRVVGKASSACRKSTRNWYVSYKATSYKGHFIKKHQSGTLKCKASSRMCHTTKWSHVSSCAIFSSVYIPVNVNNVLLLT